MYHIAFKAIKARCVRKCVKWPVAVYRIQIVPDSAFEAVFYVNVGFMYSINLHYIHHPDKINELRCTRLNLFYIQ